jgi:carbamoyltransferase
VFQNSVVNGKILGSGLFQAVHVPPVPGDHGGALGAALFVYHDTTKAQRKEVRFSPFTGPEYKVAEIESALRENASSVRWSSPVSVAESAAQRLAAGEILGWFQGRMEYGPRARGQRSILASPLRKEMKDAVNERIKHRETYRPFAGAVPEELASQFFELKEPSPYMQFVVPVRPASQQMIPAVVHNGTCRAQTVDRGEDPLFHELLMEFGNLTGCPILLNTSFNDADEPIVCSPTDAIKSFLRTKLDALAIGPFIVEQSH